MLSRRLDVVLSKRKYVHLLYLDAPQIHYGFLTVQAYVPLARSYKNERLILEIVSIFARPVFMTVDFDEIRYREFTIKIIWGGDSIYQYQLTVLKTCPYCTSGLNRNSSRFISKTITL
jgi:hypothetical protein